MRIIALCGTTNAGKTSALELLVNQLRDKDWTVVRYENDVRFICEYEDVRICICTEGDDSKTIVENFDFCRRKKCDIAIIPLRMNDKQWNLCHEFVKACRDDVPRFVYKLGDFYKETQNWNIDAIVCEQLLTMIKNDTKVMRK